MGPYLKTSVSAALLAATIALIVASALAIPQNTYWRVPRSPFGDKLARMPDPPAMILKGAPPAEPHDPYHRVYRCWGYLGKPKAIGWVKLFFINGTLPGPAVCRGVLNLHRDCFPDMFKIWFFADLRRVGRLRRHCLNVVRTALPEADD